MEHANNHQHIDKVTFAGLLIALGIVFGDIGTSPLYVFSAIVGSREIEPMLVLGGLSAVFWTLTLQTTLKYVLFVLSADNNGEGGVFSLYTLVRQHAGKWILLPTMLGGTFILAEGIITPPISVSAAVEGLRIYSPDLPTIPIVIAILVMIFVAQQFGTQNIGRLFGPVMMIWFTFIAVMGLMSFVQDLSVLKAINPYYAYQLLAEYPHGFLAARGSFSLHNRSRGFVFRFGTRRTLKYQNQLGLRQNLFALELRRANRLACQQTGNSTGRHHTFLRNCPADYFAGSDCDCNVGGDHCLASLNLR